jgi:hypothetical protein
MWHHNRTKPAAEPEPVNIEGEMTVHFEGPFYTQDLRITCIEILDVGVDPMTFRREVSWDMYDQFEIPEIGTTFQIVREFDEQGEDCGTQHFRASVVRVEDIR